MTTDQYPQPFPTVCASDLADLDPRHEWLIDSLWTRTGVGVIGGPPKSAKSWLGLDLALSVSSGTQALDRFAIAESGPVLLYMAEDAAPIVKARLLALCRHRHQSLSCLPIHVITQPVVRLDIELDRKRLARTVAAVQPRLLLLDPFVRVHRLNENDASAISALLAYLRALQRRFELAVIIVHHTRKNHNPALQDGQNLRGSGDFHAWADDSLYLRRHRDHLRLTPEHRSAPAAPPLALRLISHDNCTYLQIIDDDPFAAQPPASLDAQLLAALQQSEAPLSRAALRRQLSVRNERLGHSLDRLQAGEQIARCADGWTAVPVPHPSEQWERNGDLTTARSEPQSSVPNPG